MKKDSRIKLWEVISIFVFGIIFLDARLTNYIYPFRYSYHVVSVSISLALIYWLRKYKEIPLKLYPKPENIGKTFLYFLACSAVLIPLGLFTGFAKFHFSFQKLIESPVILFFVYILIGVIEELGFRQILMVYLEQKFNFLFGLLLSSIIFGLFHINNGGFPNWEYALLATIAGVFYGIVFKKVGFAEAVLLHSLVDVSRVVFFG